MALAKWDPFDDMKLFLDNAFDLGAARKIGWDFALDVFEEGDQLVAKMHAPGIDPEEIDVQVEHDLLKLTVSRKEDQEQKGKNYYSREIRHGQFERSIRLPVEVDSDRSNATYKNGVLSVVMPKKSPQVVSKKLNVSVE